MVDCRVLALMVPSPSGQPAASAAFLFAQSRSHGVWRGRRRRRASSPLRGHGELDSAAGDDDLGWQGETEGREEVRC